MKKNFLLGLLVTCAFTAQAQQKIKDGTGTPVTSLPAAGSLLELQSTQAGLRMPQVSLTSTIVWAPLLGLGTAATSPGMSVFNTNAAITGTSGYPAVGIGEYYWDGSGWVGKNATTVTKAEYLQLSNPTNQTITVTGQVLIFGGSTDSYYSPSGSITFTANSVTLTPGKSYVLKFSPLQTSHINATTAGPAANAYCLFRWFDNTAGAYVGQPGSSAYVFWGAATQVQGFDPVAEAIVTPTVTTTYSVKTTGGTTYNMLFNGQRITVTTLP